MKNLLVIIVVVWLVVGMFAAFQRGYFGDERKARCVTVADIALTAAAGPLNYFEFNPRVKCSRPRPSR